MDGYCVKCRQKREIEGGKQVKLKTGMKAMKGKCGHCGTKMYRIIGR